jgi:type II secretion system protein G
VLKMLLAALRSRKANRGFTLIELLVVVAIIGLLAAFAVPKLFEAINKSKGAQGAADLKTISAALERYYFDNNKYPIPTGASSTAKADSVKAALAPYLKGSTTYANGFGKGFFYGTDAAGTGGYVLVDAKNTSLAVTVCGQSWTPSATLEANASITDYTTCSTPTGMAMETN